MNFKKSANSYQVFTLAFKFHLENASEISSPLPELNVFRNA